MLAPRDLPLLPVFVAVASHGSFTLAARELQLAKSVVSQHVRTLEARCGVRLIERTTRRLHVTQVGAQVLDAAREVLQSVRALERVVEGEREEPSGTLRITAPNDSELGTVVARVSADLLRRHPGLRVELIFDDAVRDLVKEGLDLAIRLGPVVESSYVARRLGAEHEIVVASPSVADVRGDASSPRDLSGAPWVVHSALRTRSVWTLRNEAGDKQRVAVDVRASVNGAQAMRDLLVGGAGYGVVPAHMVRSDVAGGRLVRVCPAWFLRRISLHALLPARQSPPRVRVFLTALIEGVRAMGFAAR